MQVYLDNSATTKPSPAAANALKDAAEMHWYNPSALYKPAMDVEKRVSEARECCLRAVHATSHRLVFTSGGTEADNLAITGYLRTVKKGGKVLYFQGEHPAVRACMDEARRLGFTAEEIPSTSQGMMDIASLERQLTADTVLLCLMQVNNETGAVQPVSEAVSLRNRLAPKAAIHVDGVQGYLRVPLDFNRSGIQSYAFSGHKIHACKGIGGLILHKSHRVSPLMLGGGQENGLRSGTENTPGILCLGEAVRTYPADALPRMAALKEQLWKGIRERIPAAVQNGPTIGTSGAAPHILSVSLPPVRSQTMLFALEGDGIYVSAGSACASHSQRVSPVLTGMGMDRSMADCTLRFSFGIYNTEEEISYTVERIAAQYAVLSKYIRK